ncbi:MAG TPA: hypothetical protein VGC08_03050, partial [Pedobacter sp.]
MTVFTAFLSTNSSGQVKSAYSLHIDTAREYYQEKEYIKAAGHYTKAFLSNHNLGRSDHRYDAARCWALGGEIDSAFYQLERCVKSNYDHYIEMSTDIAFVNLRADKRWGTVLDGVKANRQ